MLYINSLYTIFIFREKCFTSSIYSQDQASELTLLLHQVDDLLDGTPDHQTKAFNLLKENEEEYANNAEVIWRLAKATRLMSVIKDKLGDKKAKLVFNINYSFYF